VIHEFGRYTIHGQCNVIRHYSESYATLDVRHRMQNILLGLSHGGIFLTQQFKRLGFRYDILRHFNNSIRSKYILQSNGTQDKDESQLQDSDNS